MKQDSNQLSRIITYIFQVGLLAIIYHLAAELGLLMAHVQPNTSPVWPPTGIALAVLLLFGFRFWPGIALGVMLGTVVNGVALNITVGLSIGNTLEALAAALFLKRFIKFHNTLNRIQDVIGLAIIAALSTTISATVGGITLLLTGSEIGQVFFTVWYTWWIGDFLGALVVTPLILVWFTHLPIEWKWRYVKEGMPLLILLLIVTWYVFGYQPSSQVTHEALIYVIFPFVIYAALRFTQIGAVSVVFIVSGIAIWGTAVGIGPLVRFSINESLILLQTFMGVVSLTALTLAAATSQQQGAEEALNQKLDDLAKLNEASQNFLGNFDRLLTYEVICRLAVERFGLTGAWIYLLNSEPESPAFVASRGITISEIEKLQIPTKDTSRSRYLSTIQTAQVHVENKLADRSGRFGSFASFPLNFTEKQIGHLNLVSSKINFFTDDRILLIQSYANLAAVAIQSAWLFDQVKSGNERLHALSHRLMEVQEEERLHLSRELHDESGQVMSAILVHLGLLERDSYDPDLIHKHTEELKRISKEVLSNLHEMAIKLRPASLDHLGLVTTLQQYIADFSQQHNLEVDFETVGITNKRPPLEVETALFRAVQESLTNVVLHANANHVDVLLSYRGGKLVTMVEDNGVGFTPDQVAEQSHLGLFGMRERVEMLGGQMLVESTIGKGTTILVEVPCED